MTFCQIILKQSLVDEVWNHAGWKKKCKAHQKKHPEDPLPFPYNDPDPQVRISYILNGLAIWTGGHTCRLN